MSRITIYCLCEGYSEQNLVNKILAPHLGLCGIDMHAPIVRTRRDKKAGQVHIGGGNSFLKYRNDLERLARQYASHDNVYFTTLIDLYALPTDFPGYEQAMSMTNCYEKINQLESELYQEAESMGIAHKFISHLELHEFETLILVQPNALSTLFLEHDTAINNLKIEIDAFTNVEEINHTPEGAPSKRIERHIPVYKNYKRSAQNGAINVLEVIELPALRQACQHFNTWIERLENLAFPPPSIH